MKKKVGRPRIDPKKKRQPVTVMLSPELASHLKKSRQKNNIVESALKAWLKK